MQLLDPSGRAIEARYVVASEWVGIVVGRSATSETMHFAAGGLAHALDTELNQVVCGADLASLEIVAVEFTDDPWAFRCTTCERLVAVETVDVTR